MMLVLKLRGLLNDGEYVVLYVDLEPYSREQSYKYLYGADMSFQEQHAMAEAAESLLVIVPSPPDHQYTQFEDRVRDHNHLPPFEFPNPFRALERKKHITVYASYLYDAVKLYAEALVNVTRSGGCITNGTAIIRRIIEKGSYT